MQANQYSVKVYETAITDEDQFIAFFDTNAILFQNHLIVIQEGLSQRIEKYLKKKKLHYMSQVQLPKKRINQKRIDQTVQEEIERHKASKQQAMEALEALHHKLQNNLTVLDKIIRSGRELEIEGDLLLLNRVNSGATLKVSGNLIITKMVEGAIYCEGKFMMLTASSKAYIEFNGREVDTAALKDKLNRVALIKNEIVITPVLKKEIDWVQ